MKKAEGKNVYDFLIVIISLIILFAGILFLFYRGSLCKKEVNASTGFSITYEKFFDYSKKMRNKILTNKLELDFSNYRINELMQNNIEYYTENIEVHISAFEGSVAYETNNPCNLAYAGQSGATKQGRFAKFETPQLGFLACLKQIRLDQYRDKTLEQFISIYAPKNENNTELYIKTICYNLGVSRDTNIADINLISLAKEVAKFESKTVIYEIN